jgi:hypothetical protein
MLRSLATTSLKSHCWDDNVDDVTSMATSLTDVEDYADEDDIVDDADDYADNDVDDDDGGEARDTTTTLWLHIMQLH